MNPLLRSPLTGLALFFAVLSAGLWVWSRRIPDSQWEHSTAVSTPVPVPETTPAPSPAPEAPIAAAAPNPTITPEPPSPTVPESTPVPSSTAEATPSPSPTPTPTDAELAGPLPAHSPGESATIPAPSTETAPPPPELSIAEIARQPDLWPRQVILTAPVRFPVIIRGVNAGSLQVPPGKVVLLRKVNADGTVEVELPGSPGSLAKISARGTDLVIRAKEMAAARQKTSPTP